MPKKSKKKRTDKLIVVCHNIRSAFNVGSIFRTADGAGAGKIILGGYSAYPPHPKLVKTALGAERSVPYERVWQTWRALEKLKKEGCRIVALEKNSRAQNIFKFKPRFPLALVLGNEVKGLSKEILKRCDEVVFLPMRGRKESLNVSVAFGAAAYQLLNKEKKHG